MVDADQRSLEAKAKRLKTRWPIYAEIIDWLVNLLSEVYRAEDRACRPPNSWDRSLLSQRIRSEKPLFEASDIPFDMESTRDVYAVLVNRTERQRGKLKSLRRLLSGPRDEARFVLDAALACEPEKLESVCSKYGADSSLADLLLRLALQPSLRQLSRRAEKEFDLAGWSSGRCPVCGSRPNLATLGEGDKSRTLYCSVCETSWNFPRLKCPFCGNGQPEGLSYIYAEEEKDLMVDLCERCGQGIGTIDTNYHAEPIIPVLDQLAISHLAMAATKNGNHSILS